MTTIIVSSGITTVATVIPIDTNYIRRVFPELYKAAARHPVGGSSASSNAHV
jgi:hypothetical protein